MLKIQSVEVEAEQSDQGFATGIIAFTVKAGGDLDVTSKLKIDITKDGVTGIGGKKDNGSN